MSNGALTTIDVHAHWTPPSALAACAHERLWHGLQMGRTEEGLPTALLSGKQAPFASSALHFDSLGGRIEAMDQDGITIQILSLLPQLFGYNRANDPNQTFCAAVNDELAAELHSAPPGRFLGMGVVPLQYPSHAVAEIERCVRDLGLVGIAVGTNVRGSRWADNDLWRVLEAAEDLGTIVFLHPNAPSGFPIPEGYRLRNVFGNPADTTIVLQTLVFSGALARFPGLKLVAAHGGGYTAMALGRMEHSWRVRHESRRETSISPTAALSGVMVDTVVHHPEALRFLVRVFGVENVVVGTDFPADMGLARPTEFVASALAGDDEAVSAVLSGNLRRVLAVDPLATGGVAS